MLEVLIRLRKIDTLNSINQINHFFCSRTCWEKLKKKNGCYKITDCMCFTRNRRSY